MAQIYFPAGTFAAKIKKHKLSPSGTGSPQLAITIVPYLMANPAVPDDDPGYWCPMPVSVNPDYPPRIFLSLTEAAIDYTCDKLATITNMAEVDSWAQFDCEDPNPVPLIDKEVIVVCKHERSKTDGIVREKWDFPFGAKEAKPLEQDEVMKLDALFGSRLRPGGARPAAARPAQSLAHTAQAVASNPLSGTPRPAPQPHAAAAQVSSRPASPPPPAPKWVDPGPQGNADDDQIPF